MSVEVSLAGAEYCPCGRIARKIVRKSEGSKRIDISKDISQRALPGFVMMFPSNYAADGLCWRCSKPDYYFEVGKQS